MHARNFNFFEEGISDFYQTKKFSLCRPHENFLITSATYHHKIYDAWGFNNLITDRKKQKIFKNGYFLWISNEIPTPMGIPHSPFP